MSRRSPGAPSTGCDRDGDRELDDEQDARKKWWKLPDSILAALEEVTEPDDEMEIEEIDVDVPDTLPEDWEDEDGS